nr:hypothetical protein [Tanacetum cinerariifolium]
MAGCHSLATLVRSFKLIEVYIEHDVTVVDSYRRPPPRVMATIEDITGEPGSFAPIEHRSEKMLLLTRHDSSEPPKERVCKSVTPRSLPEHDCSTPCKDSVCESVTPRCLPHCMLTHYSGESVITYTQLSGVQRVDIQDHVLLIIQLQFSDKNLSFVSQQATASHVIDDVLRQLSFKKTELDGEAGFANVAGSGVESFGLSHDECRENSRTIVVEIRTQEPIMEESSKDACTNDDDDDDEDEDLLVDEENKIVEPNVDVHLFGISMDILFDNIGITNLVPDDVLEEEDEFTTAKEAKDIVYLHSIESRRNLKLYKNDSVRVRARCDEKVHVFTMSYGRGPSGPNHKMKAGPSGSSSPSTRGKRKEYREIKHRTYKFLFEKIFDQVNVNPEILVKAIQDQLQRNLELHISKSKAFRAIAKAEREIIGDHVLQYSMLRDYVVELHSTNPNTNVKIAVEKYIDSSLPTRVFQRIYVYLGALKLAVRLDSNKEIYPLAYALVEAERLSAADGQGSTGDAGVGVGDQGLGGGGYLRDYVRVVAGMNDRDFDSELVIPTPWSDESKNEKWQKEMPSKAVEQKMYDHVPDEIDGANCEQLPNHVVKKSNLEFLVCKQVANQGGDELVDKGRPLKRKRVYAE